MARGSLLDAYQDDLRRGAHPTVARIKVRSALIRRWGAARVARHVVCITRILERAEEQVHRETTGPGTDPAA